MERQTPNDADSPPLAERRILLGVSGGIAAYKAAELVRRLVRSGAQVRVALTDAAARFITPLTLQALSGHRVHQHLMDEQAEASMGHIELARWAERILIAPASADLLARLAHGLADDLLSATCLASTAPLAVAPAMNRVMWEAPATRANVQLLAARGILVWGPDDGAQACGETGPGRMLEPAELATRVRDWLGGGRLCGKRVLVTAGPTREDLDPVRFLSNRSSGRMGFALAEAAARAGATVTLVAGPVALVTPAAVERVDVWSAEQMLEAVLARVSDCDLFIGAAAVADFRPARPVGHKVKKTTASLSIRLEPNPDILARVTGLARPPFSLGFAAETDDLRSNALDKLKRKRLDMIAANPVGVADSGFDGPNNRITVFWPGGELDLGHDSKSVLAERLIACVADRLPAAADVGSGVGDCYA